MHCHLLPGIDDGAKDLAESLGLLQQMTDLGFQTIIATPHINSAYYPNTPATIKSAWQQVTQASLSIDLFYAAEYFMDEYFESLLEEKAKLLSFGNKYVLVEMSFFGAPPKLEDYIFKLQLLGYKPILAHPERYTFYHGQIKSYERFRDLGCLLQVNLLSLAGEYGSEIAEVGRQLVQSNNVDLLGSDVHHERHLSKLRTALGEKKFLKCLLDYNYRNKDLLHE